MLSEAETKHLERQLDRKLREDAELARSIGYGPSVFLTMLANHGPVETCRRVIIPKWPPDGFLKLLELKRLDLTVENTVLHGPWRVLFEDTVLTKAKKNLKDYGRPDLANYD